MEGTTSVMTSLAAGLQIAQGMIQMQKSDHYHGEGIGIAKDQHKEDVRLAKQLHEKEIREAQNLHHDELAKMMLQQKKEHLMSTYSNLESHFVQLDVDLVNALKESERDMYDQRNQQLNTLILSSTVMLAALTTLLIEGSLPAEIEEMWTILFSLACGCSFALQLLCVVLCKCRCLPCLPVARL
jgi:hypothetical protein